MTPTAGDSPVCSDPTARQTRARAPRRRLLFVGLALLVAVLTAAAVYAVLGGLDKNVTKRLSGGGTKVVRVALVDAFVGFDVTPDTVVVEPRTRLVLDVVNEGKGVHDLALPGGPRTRVLDPGEHSGSTWET